MLTRLIYASSQPPRRPLLQVTLYYSALAGLLAVVAVTLPDLLALALSAPPDLPGVVRPGDAYVQGMPADEMMRDGFETTVRLLTSLFAALALMLPTSWVYMGTRSRSGFDQGIVQTMIILPIAVAGIVTIVHDSIALAFSLAGIVAAVRFRNALEQTADALYIFAAIGVGLASGIGALPIAAVVSIVFNYTILLLWRCDYGVCPKGGPMLEFTSGQMLDRMGVDLPPQVPAKKKKKKKKRKHAVPAAAAPPAVATATGEPAAPAAPTASGSADPPPATPRADAID